MQTSAQIKRMNWILPSDILYRWDEENGKQGLFFPENFSGFVYKNEFSQENGRIEFYYRSTGNIHWVQVGFRVNSLMADLNGYYVGFYGVDKGPRFSILKNSFGHISSLAEGKYDIKESGLGVIRIDFNGPEIKASISSPEGILEELSAEDITYKKGTVAVGKLATDIKTPGIFAYDILID